jgi:hypothetical protein
MTFNDILLEQQLEKARKLDHTWALFQEEALRMDRAAHPRRGVVRMLRHAAASMLARMSFWIDRRAGERVFAAPTR